MSPSIKQNPIRSFLYLGIPDDASFIDRQKGYMFNLFILIGAPFAILSLIVNLFEKAYFPAFVNIIQISCFSLALWITISGKWKEYRVVILIILSVVAMIAAYSYQNSGEYRLLIMIVAAVVLFDRSWQYMIFAATACAAFVYIRMSQIPDLAIQPFGDVVFTCLKIFLPILLYVLSLLYFKIIYFKNLQQLEDTNKVLAITTRQKDQILSTVAHDLRTPISNISNITELIQSDQLSQADKVNFLRMIDQSSRSALHLINDLLQNSDTQVRALHFKIIELNQIVNSWIPSLQLRATETNIQLLSHFFSAPINISIDVDRIERVINNLVNNAIKFSSEGSKIFIQITADNTYARIIVTDQGIGIPKEKQGLVFDMFSKAQRLGTSGEKSFGMGLSICKQIIEQHHGNIFVQSEEHKGSTFMIELPFHQP
ncbi:MAG: HAMP domain-containing histidine kinase [Chitinophagaceae bacterium]|nr:HAMP domain-containing histidine kinase [Chitinophagaceae bacterium]